MIYRIVLIISLINLNTLFDLNLFAQGNSNNEMIEYQNWRSELENNRNSLNKYNQQIGIYGLSALGFAGGAAFIDDQSIKIVSLVGMLGSVILGTSAKTRANSAKYKINSLTLLGQKKDWIINPPNFRNLNKNISTEENSLEKRLQSLKKLFDNGLITKEEYELRRKEILKEYLKP
ncbi:MAG: SHOCT domain-containing protein [Balneola sp.]